MGFPHGPLLLRCAPGHRRWTSGRDALLSGRHAGALALHPPTYGRGHGVQAVSNTVGEGSIPSVRAPRAGEASCRMIRTTLRAGVRCGRRPTGREARRGSAHARTGRRGPWRTTGPPCSCPGRLAGQDAGLSHRSCGFESRPGYRCDRGVRSEAHGVASAADRVRVPAVALRWGSWWPRWWLATTRAGFDSPGLHSHRQDREPIPPCSVRESSSIRPLSGPAARPPDPVTTRHYTLSDAPGGAARLSPG